MPAAGLKPILPQPSVAVLPFSLSGDAQQVANLSSGMTSELVRELARYSSVFVLGPQSVSRFGPAPDVVVIGEAAGVGFVLSGDIQHEIGRASCRERGCRYVEISVVAVSLKK